MTYSDLGKILVIGLVIAVLGVGSAMLANGIITAHAQDRSFVEIHVLLENRLLAMRMPKEEAERLQVGDVFQKRGYGCRDTHKRFEIVGRYREFERGALGVGDCTFIASECLKSPCVTQSLDGVWMARRVTE